jgi:hypothetical protein
MRKLVALGGVALAAALSATFAVAGGGSATPKSERSLSAAAAKTEAAASERYAIHVRLTRQGTPMALHIRGQASAHTVSVAMRMNDLTLDDGTVVPGPNGAALLHGPFLYERAPSNIAVNGDVQWLRLPVASLSPGSADLATVRSMSPAPLLRLLRAVHVVPGKNELAFNGWIAYGDRAMRRLSRLTGALEFRHLRVSAVAGHDGRVHRIVLTGRTADGKTTLSLRARLFAFGKPVHVTPPKPANFMDEQLAQMPA